MTRRGSILLEVLLAIAVFAFAGVVVMGVLQETVAATERASRRAVAMDLARTRLADIEAGLAPGAEIDQTEDDATGLRVRAHLEPSEYEGLELAVVEVWSDAPGEPTALMQALSGAATEPPRLAVLRQLVRTGSAPARVPRPEFSP